MKIKLTSAKPEAKASSLGLAELGNNKMFCLVSGDLLALQPGVGTLL